MKPVFLGSENTYVYYLHPGGFQLTLKIKIIY